MKPRAVSGGVLIVLGLILLAVTRTKVGGEVIVALLGSAFLVGFAFSRSYGLLIPGSILTGLGLGILLIHTAPNGAPVLLGLGSGFAAIYLVDSILGNRRVGGWWPLIPGGILLTIGFGLHGFGGQLFRMIWRWWPLGIIVLGVWLVMGRNSRPTGSDVSSPK